jgi:hypothetical protein
MRVPRIAALAAFASAAVLFACGSEEEDTPAACLNGPESFLAALEEAPGEARLADGVPISACLIDDQPVGELSQVGETLVASAERLGAAARAQPQGSAGVRLGYLVGAVERGAEGTGGVHAELVRRLESVAATGAGSLPFDSAYSRGLTAGRETG